MLALRKSAVYEQYNESKENTGYKGRTVLMASGIRSNVNRSNKASNFTVQENTHRS